MTGRPAGEATLVDLYACFPSAVQLQAAALLFGLSLFWFSLLGLTLGRPLMRQRLLQVAPTIDFVCGLVFLLVAVSIVGRLLL